MPGGNIYIAYTSLPEGISAEGFDVFYYGDNENLIDREGVTLEGWVNETDSSGEMTAYLPDDLLKYEMLPEGDTIDLYAVWYDPVMYGITYHANRSDSDGYVVEDVQFTGDDDSLLIDGPEAGDEEMRNEGKTFKGWNTEADGSGAWYTDGDNATPDHLALGTRAQYVKDLEELAALQIDDTLVYYTEDYSKTDSASDEMEAEIKEKYTVHLYAQWEEDPTTDTTTAETTDTTTAETTDTASTECTDDTANATTVTSESSSGASKSNKGTSANTGDNNLISLWITLSCLAAAILGTAIVLRLKKRKV